MLKTKPKKITYNCKKCNFETFIKVKRCPYCHSAIEEQKFSLSSRISLMFGIFFLLVLLIHLFLAFGTNNPKLQERYRKLMDVYQNKGS